MSSSEQVHSYDAFTAQVIQQRLKNVVEEMATMLLRTSGSPVLTEAQDFCTAIFDVDGEHVAFSGYVVAHLGSSLLGVQAVIREYGLEDISPGDAFICNDAYTAGAIHQGDVGVISPIYHDSQLVGWAFSNAHVLDVGGMSPGGWAPEAYDVFSEALSLPAIRIAENGRILRDIQRIIMRNVRVPVPVINDIKSLIVANLTAERRVQELVAKYGLETYKMYCGVNKELADNLIRKRVASIPDGVYRSQEWVEYDGHGIQELYPLMCSVTVAEDHMTVDLSGSAAQSNGFVNAGPGAIIGCLEGVLVMMLGSDVPVNAGMFRSMEIKFGDPGTIVNPLPPAPTSCGHMETGGKTEKAFIEALTKALQLSQDPWVRNRVAAISHNCWPGNAWIGLDQYGEYTAFPVFDCGSAGIGAQATGDGLDVGAFDMQLNNGIPEVETNEGVYPMLYLYRRLHVNSGGPGFYRGGQGLDLAWVPYNHGQGLLGTMENACGQMPAHGTLGGYPGAVTVFLKSDNFDLGQYIREHGRMPGPDDVTGLIQLRNHLASTTLGPYGVFRQITGGGSGLGDPLLRPLAWVERDLRDGYISPMLAKEAYGVVYNDETKRVDAQASEALRTLLRTERLGHKPLKDFTEESPTFFRAPLGVFDTPGRREIYCAFCGTDLGMREDEQWKKQTVVRSHELMGTMRRMGIECQGLEGYRRDLVEYICPDCGTMLQTEVSASLIELAPMGT